MAVAVVHAHITYLTVYIYSTQRACHAGYVFPLRWHLANISLQSIYQNPFTNRPITQAYTISSIITMTYIG